MCVVIWNREGYLPEGYRQVSDISPYNDVKRFNQKLLSDLTENSSIIFKKLYNKKCIIEKELKYFSYSFKNVCCLDKMYLLSKIYKKLYDVPGCPVIPTTGLLQKEWQNFYITIFNLSGLYYVSIIAVRFHAVLKFISDRPLVSI